MTEDGRTELILRTIISAQIGCYMSEYAPTEAVLTTSGIQRLTDLKKHTIRKLCKELIAEGLIEYVHQGRPAIVSHGEYEELVCEAMPPVNGYKLTDKGYQTDMYKNAYEDWKKGLEEWANKTEIDDEEWASGVGQTFSP